MHIGLLLSICKGRGLLPREENVEFTQALLLGRVVPMWVETPGGILGLSAEGGGAMGEGGGRSAGRGARRGGCKMKNSFNEGGPHNFNQILTGKGEGTGKLCFIVCFYC